MNLRDTLERFAWTVIAAAITNITAADLFDLAAWEAAALAGLNGAMTFLLVVARARLAVLPDPGAGLPGLPTDDTVDVNARLRGAGIWDDEPTTPDRGAVAWGTIAICVIAVVAVLFAFGKLPLDL